MRIALEEASDAAKHGEVPVGALIVDADGVILSRAANYMERCNNPLAHAELLALGMASKKKGKNRLSNSVLIVTLEPCLMCAAAINHARVGGLVFGAADIRAGAIISKFDYINLPDARKDFWHLGGILSDSCTCILKEFFKKQRLT